MADDYIEAGEIVIPIGNFSNLTIICSTSQQADKMFRILCEKYDNIINDKKYRQIKLLDGRIISVFDEIESRQVVRGARAQILHYVR